MLRRLLLLTGMTLILGLVIPLSAAAPTDWQAWFYNPDTAELVRVGLPQNATAHTVEEYTLTPAATGMGIDATLGTSMGVSANRERIAYCAGGDDQGNAPLTLIVYDPFTDTVNHQIPLGTGVGCSVTSAGFDDTTNTLAFGVLYTSPYNVQSSGGWEVVVFDLANQQRVFGVTNQNIPNAPEFAMPFVTFYVPNNNVTFSLRPIATEGPGDTIPTYTWTLGTNTVSENFVNNKTSSDTLGGWLVWAENDQTYPIVQAQPGILPPKNVIKLQGKNGIPTVIANPTQGLINSVLFIAGGQQIAYNMLDGSYEPLGWFALDQNGSTTPLPINRTGIFKNVLAGNIAGTPNGYIYMEETSAGTSIWSGTGSSQTQALLWDASTQNWEMISAEQMEPQATINYPSVATTGQPPAQTGSGPCPGHIATRLQPNMQARITPGPPNNLRANPSLNAADIGNIPGEAPILILGGPVCANNMTWWQVQYNNQVGWTSEGTGSEYWIEPLP